MHSTLTVAVEEARNFVGHKLSRGIFEQFNHSNNRLIMAVTCLKEGFKEVAFNLFVSIIEEGPKQSKDAHFAYVRSLVEVAELEAESGDFVSAEKHLRLALETFPEKMSYMMSRVHLEVYLAYYCFRSGGKVDAYTQIAWVCQKEQKRFKELLLQDAYDLVGPGLCYAIHQWALFYAEDGNWERAIHKLKEIASYTSSQLELLNQDQELGDGDDLESVFYSYEQAIYYT